MCIYIQSAAKITNIHEFVLYMKRYMDALYENISHHLIETMVTAGAAARNFTMCFGLAQGAFIFAA